MPLAHRRLGGMHLLTWHLLLFLAGFAGCNGDRSPDGPKLAAFRKVISVYRDTPSDFAAPGQKERFNDRLRKVQDAFDRVPFDAAKQRNEAVAIVRLYESEIQGRYSGELHRLLENQIGSIAEDLSFSE
jgi:hypothetical protein